VKIVVHCWSIRKKKKIRAIDEQEYEKKRDGIIWKTSYVKLDIMRLIKILPFQIYKFSKVLNERTRVYFASGQTFQNFYFLYYWD
jgi:hypothetical protein